MALNFKYQSRCRFLYLPWPTSNPRQALVALLTLPAAAVGSDARLIESRFASGQEGYRDHPDAVHYLSPKLEAFDVEKKHMFKTSTPRYQVQFVIVLMAQKFVSSWSHVMFQWRHAQPSILGLPYRKEIDRRHGTEMPIFLKHWGTSFSCIWPCTFFLPTTAPQGKTRSKDKMEGFDCSSNKFHMF